MPNVNEMFGSDYVKASDLRGQAFVMTMGQVYEKSAVGQDGKREIYWVLHFANAKKALRLNQTNGRAIADLYGPVTEGWAGHSIELYPDVTKYLGRETPCVRVRAPSGPHTAPPPPSDDPLPADQGDDSIPF